MVFDGEKGRVWGGGVAKVGDSSMQMHLPHNFRRNGGPSTKRRKCRFLTAYVRVCVCVCVRVCACVCVGKRTTSDMSVSLALSAGVSARYSTPHFPHFSFRFVSFRLCILVCKLIENFPTCSCVRVPFVCGCLCVCVSAHVGHINACFTIAHAPQFLAGPTFWGQLYLMILAIMHLKHSQFYCQPNGQDNARITSKWERVCVWISGLTFGWAAKKLR